MLKSIDLLNRLKVEKQLLSNRQVALFLNTSHTAVNRIEKGGVWNDDLACIVAQELGLDVDFVLLAIIAERSHEERTIEAIESVLDKKHLA